MSGKRLSELVSDWGGFERLVAQLHETGRVEVEHNVTLPGKSGAPRQIDVLVRHTEGLYEHLIVVECKYRNSPAERLHVDALAKTISEVGASRGVIFSTEGFQSGAITQAQHDNISLFQLREPTDAEWGLPGRHVDIWLQFVSYSLGNLRFPQPMPVIFRPYLPLGPINIEFDMGNPKSRTPIVIDGKPDNTMEELLLRMAEATVRAVYQPVRMDFDGKSSGDIRHVVPVRFQPDSPTIMFIDAGFIITPVILFDLGIKISQSRLQIDRAEPYAFVLAVQDCVSSGVTAASRKLGEAHTVLKAIVPEATTSGTIWANGSIMSIWLKPHEPFSDFAGVNPSSGSENVTLKL